MDTNNLKNKENWLQRQQNMFKNMDGYEGQRAPDECKHTRDQMVHSLHSLPVTSHIKKMRHYSPAVLNSPAMRGFQDRSEAGQENLALGYAPCAQPLADLEPLASLRDLVIESHHPGRVLVVRSFVDPVRCECFVNAVEDADNNVDRLALFNLSHLVAPANVLPRGAIFAVKEPYYRRALDGGVLIRADHPSDVIILDPDNPLVPAAWRDLPLPDTPFTAQDRFKQAEAALALAQWHKAQTLFTEALRLLPESFNTKDQNKAGMEGLRRAIHGGRSFARFRLHMCEMAAEDALEAVHPGTVKTMSTEVRNANYHAYSRAARAHYALGNFVDAKTYWILAGTYDVKFHYAPNEGEKRFFIHDEIARTNKRIEEQKEGAYDFDAMAEAVTNDQRSLDHASFLRLAKIADAGHRGRGLFATKNFQAGELIMVEKALFNVWVDKPDGKVTAIDVGDGKKKDMVPLDFKADANDRQERVYAAWNALRGNPRLVAAFLELDDGADDRHHFRGKKIMEKDVDGHMVLDMFQLRAIAERNIFECPQVQSEVKPSQNAQQQEEPEFVSWSPGVGLWMHASYLNHSCLPNAHRAIVGNMMVVRATRNIKKGDEILVAYVDPAWPFDMRKRHLAKKGLTRGCDCALCKVEAALPTAVLEKRNRAVRELSNLMEEDRDLAPFHRRPRCRVKYDKFKALAKAVRDTYDDELYAGLPRLDCVEMARWLCETSWDAREMLANAQLLMRDMGIKTSWCKKTKQMVMNRDNGAGGVLLEAVLSPLLAASCARKCIKCPYSKKGLLKCKVFAGEIYLTLNGETFKKPMSLYTRDYGASK